MYNEPYEIPNAFDNRDARNKVEKIINRKMPGLVTPQDVITRANRLDIDLTSMDSLEIEEFIQEYLL